MPLPRTTVEQWAVLAAVIDEGSFAHAADAIHRSQSAVSYTVAKLQEALDAQLLTIEGRKAVLTPMGKTLLGRARRLSRELLALESFASSLKQGWEPHLRLVIDVAFPRARLLKIVGELQQLCPSTHIEIADAVLSGADDAILDGSADIVVTTRVPPDFVGDPLGSTPFFAVAAPTHPLFAAAAPLTTEQLSNHAQCVVRDSGKAHPRDDGWLGSKVRCTVSSMEASRAMVEAGLAYAWLPQHIVDAPLRLGTIKRLPLGAGGTRDVPLSLVVVRPDIAGPAARAAVESFQRHSLLR